MKNAAGLYRPLAQDATELSLLPNLRRVSVDVEAAHRVNLGPLVRWRDSRGSHLDSSRKMRSSLSFFPNRLRYSFSN